VFNEIIELSVLKTTLPFNDTWIEPVGLLIQRKEKEKKKKKKKEKKSYKKKSKKEKNKRRKKMNTKSWDSKKEFHKYQLEWKVSNLKSNEILKLRKQQKLKNYLQE